MNHFILVCQHIKLRREVGSLSGKHITAQCLEASPRYHRTRHMCLHPKSLRWKGILTPQFVAVWQNPVESANQLVIPWCRFKTINMRGVCASTLKVIDKWAYWYTDSRRRDEHTFGQEINVLDLDRGSKWSSAKCIFLNPQSSQRAGALTFQLVVIIWTFVGSIN